MNKQRRDTWVILILSKYGTWRWLVMPHFVIHDVYLGFLFVFSWVDYKFIHCYHSKKNGWAQVPYLTSSIELQSHHSRWGSKGDIFHFILTARVSRSMHHLGQGMLLVIKPMQLSMLPSAGLLVLLPYNPNSHFPEARAIESLVLQGKKCCSASKRKLNFGPQTSQNKKWDCLSLTLATFLTKQAERWTTWQSTLRKVTVSRIKPSSTFIKPALFLELSRRWGIKLVKQGFSLKILSQKKSERWKNMSSVLDSCLSKPIVICPNYEDKLINN